jgi:CTP synthase
MGDQTRHSFASEAEIVTDPIERARIEGENGVRQFRAVVDMVEYYLLLGCQFHPEFKSKPLEPHPIFRDFIAASYQNHLRLTPTTETESQFERNL